MATSEARVDALERALHQAGLVIARIEPDQSELPTPCGEWDVRALVNHIVYDARMFAETSEGRPRPPAGEDLIDGDWSAAYSSAAGELLEVWQRPGATEGTITLPQGELPRTWRLGQQTANFAVHAWDVAKATGQPTGLDPEVGRLALEWGQENLKPEFRGAPGSGKAFGPEVPVPADAEVYDRLAGFFGRDPNASRAPRWTAT
jgi:uncharacterized protein (TIGR03086 family)